MNLDALAERLRPVAGLSEREGLLFGAMCAREEQRARLAALKTVRLPNHP